MFDISKNYVCEQCNKEYVASHIRQRFCSKACSNAGVKRRIKKITYCSAEGCNNVVSYYLNKFCKSCIDKKAHWARNSNTGKLLPEQTIAEASHKRRGGANAYDNIRCNARKIMREAIDGGVGCTHCGWNHHVQVCHIKSINSFSKDTLVSEVNDKKNLILLCPNCHWLFDNGKLKFVSNDLMVGEVGIEPTLPGLSGRRFTSL